MKENLKCFLINLIMSMFIGLVVGMAQVTVINMNSYVIEMITISSITGGVIGTISRFVFIYILAVKQMDAKLAFISVFIIIGVISGSPFLYYYLVQNEKVSIVTLMSILISAEILGMSFCYYSYRKQLEFNLKLLNKKNQLTKIE
ncbi:hypothetical protein [Clostridium thailandense]|uniref:hypothetical protein n=1 Tax=Clostridium thailandense TaxID=2794346 RepID=UPI003988E5D5